MRNLLSFILIL
jgi:hypothetical protein